MQREEDTICKVVSTTDRSIEQYDHSFDAGCPIRFKAILTSGQYASMTRKQRRATRVREKRVGRQALDVDYLGLTDGHTYWVVYEEQSDISSDMTPSGHLLLEDGEDSCDESEIDSDNKSDASGGGENDDSKNSDEKDIRDDKDVDDEDISVLETDIAAVREKWLALARQSLSQAHSRLDAQCVELSRKAYIYDNHRCVHTKMVVCMVTAIKFVFSSKPIVYIYIYIRII